jgi:large subunit ribosomal protein L32e
MKRKFLRRDWNKMIRLGGRRKKLKWRRSKGMHAKIRQKWKGYSQMPSPGYKTPRKTRGLIENKIPVIINNVQDLLRIKTNEIGILSKTVGKKKKIEIAKKALEMKANFANFDANKFLEEIKKEQEQKKHEKEGGKKKEVKKEKVGEKKEEKSEPKKEEKAEEKKSQDKTVQVQSEKEKAGEAK